MSDYLTDLNAHYKAVRDRLSPKPQEPKVVAPEPPEPPAETTEIVAAPEPVAPQKPYPMKGVFLPAEIKADIICVLRKFDMQWLDAIGPRKTNKHLMVRAHIYVAVRKHGWSYQRIARLCGNRDHTTILNALQNPEKWGAGQ
jgi:hypothetical protein